MEIYNCPAIPLGTYSMCLGICQSITTLAAVFRDQRTQHCSTKHVHAALLYTSKRALCERAVHAHLKDRTTCLIHSH
jgi:hypothetical protein